MSEPASPPIPSFSSVIPTLPVADIERAITFYTVVLGFRLQFRNGSTFAIVAWDRVEIGLIAADFGGVPAGLGRCYCKLSAGIDALYASYQQREVTILHELRDETYQMREFMISDPDRNEINFGQPL